MYYVHPNATRVPETTTNKANATYSPEVEKQVREWIEAVTGEKLGSSLGESLKSGGIQRILQK